MLTFLGPNEGSKSYEKKKSKNVPMISIKYGSYYTRKKVSFYNENINSLYNLFKTQ